MYRSPRAANGAASPFAATTRRLSGSVTLVTVCERCLTCFMTSGVARGRLLLTRIHRTAVPSLRPPNGEPRAAVAPVRPCHATVGPWRLRRGLLGSGRSEYTTSRCWVPSQPLARLRGRREAAETQFAAYRRTDWRGSLGQRGISQGGMYVLSGMVDLAAALVVVTLC